MADAIVSAVLQQLVTIISEKAKQEVELVTGVDREIKKLTSNCQAIQAVLQDAERKQVKEDSVRHWLNELKEVSYDLEDVLDEWKTCLLRLKIRQQQKPHNKVCSFLPSPCFCIKQLAFRHDIALKIKGINERLDFISEQKERFHFVIHERITDEERPKTTSYIDVAEVLGRKQDEAFVKGMLLSTPSGSSTQEEEALRVISIVGMGGLGKTTLAQSIYNDGEVEAHFDKRMWVCVSDPFDERRIASKILQACTGQRPRVDAMDIILQQIREHMSEKKFLLVLDDVWTQDFEKWKQLLNTLKCSLPGSRILLTTRNENVAMVFGSRQVNIFHLGILNEEDSWSLFARLAFHDRMRDEIEMLEDVGKQIIGRCEGLPLAIKTIGSYLQFKRTRKEWQNVLTSGTWEIKDDKKGLFGLLQLSYYELPSVSKRCFSYCALFPKDFYFGKDELIKLWMAQGFFEEAEEKEVIAEECFNDLVMRCFFQDLKESSDGEIYEFKIHDIVHDFAMFLSEGECYSVDSNNMDFFTREASPKSIRHMLLNIDKNQGSFQFPNNICGCKKLRSLHIQCNLMFTRINADFSALDWGQLMCVRTLKLNALEFEVLPKEVGKLEHLRQLNLSGNSNLRVLPEAICDLCNLETLDISECRSLEKLPQRIGELIKLSYLYNWQTDTLRYMPKGIGRLSKVKVIDNFVISMREKDASLAELGNLSNIKEIWITGLENIKDVNECMKVRLEDKAKLRNLALKFNMMGGEVESVKEEQVLQALSPPLCIERLQILGYNGNGLPNWMASLNNLKYLILRDCGELEQLPPQLGKLPRLASLYIGPMRRVKKVGAEFLGIPPQKMQQQLVIFPSLKCLTFIEMEGWKEWDWSDNEKEHPMPMITIMPHLSELFIHRCPSLTSIPRELLRKSTLQRLEIHDCPILEEHCKQGTGLDWPIISHIPERYIGRSKTF